MTRKNGLWLVVIIVTLMLIALVERADAQSVTVISNAVLVDATFTDELLFAGVIIHASAATALVVVTDANGEIWRWTELTDGESSGYIFPAGGIPATTKIVVTLTDCTATLARRYAHFR